MLTEPESAYLAGIIDGEGYIGAEIRPFSVERTSGDTGRPGIGVTISIANNERALMDWLQARFDGSVSSSSSRRGWRPTFSFKPRASSRQTFLEAALPYLLLKRRHAEIALFLITSRANYGVGGYPPDELRARLEAAAELQELTDRNGRRRHTARDALAWLDEYPVPERRPRGTCSVDGCDREVETRGWCGRHYQRWRTYGDPAHPVREFGVDRPCSVDGCERRARARGLCKLHWQRRSRTGDPLGLTPVRPNPEEATTA